MLVEQIRQATLDLAPLLRRRGTSPEVGKTLRRAVQQLTVALAARDEAARANGVLEAINALRACIAAGESSPRPDDREQSLDVARVLSLLAPFEQALAVPPPIGLPTPPFASWEAPAPMAAMAPALCGEAPIAPMNDGSTVPFPQPAPPARAPSTPRQNAPTESLGLVPPVAIDDDPIDWDVIGEHLDEAAFLFGRWEKALDSAVYSLEDVAEGPEERLLAHLDGLVVAGRAAAERLLLPELGGEDPARARAAAWALLAAQDADHFESVLGALAAASDPAMTAALARACALSRHPAISPRMTGLWTHAGAPLRAVVLDVLASVDFASAALLLPEAVSAREAPIRAAAYRTLRRLPNPDPAYLPYIEDGFVDEDAAVYEESLMTAFLLGSRKVWQACRRGIEAARPVRTAFGLLALSPQPEDRARLFSTLASLELRRPAIWALGFVGDVEAADRAAAYLTSKDVGKLAAEALAAISGLTMDGPFRRVGVTRGPANDEDEVGLDSPPPQVLPEDFLPEPEPDAVTAWWQQTRAGLRPNQRSVSGQERTAAALAAAMVAAPTWRRSVIAVEFAASTRRPVPCDLRGWARDQRKALAVAADPSAPPARRR